ncbi:MAG: hypothetical protein NXI32_24880, partial [bacterium]|nr:hypothetical protein [bacterium]
VSLTSNPASQSILAIGLPEDLEKVKAQFSQLIAQTPAPELRTAQVYQLLHASPAGAVSLLASLLPQASFAQDAATRTIGATGNPGEHLRISEFLKAYDVPRPSNMLTRVYRLTFGSARGLQLTLNQLIPEATIYGSRDAGVLIATATEEQHERIAAIVKEADSERPNSRTRVFALSAGSVGSLVQAVQGFAPEASVAGDQASNSLIVTATEAELQRIETMVEQLESGGPNRGITKFYPVTGSEPLPLVNALTRSFPRATFAADATSGGLFATMLEEEHADFAKVVEDLNAQSANRSKLRSFAIKHVSPEVVATAIENAFGRRSTAGVSFNRETGSVFVLGDRDELLVAQQLVEQIDVPQQSDGGRQVRAFALTGADGRSVTQAIEGLFRDSGQTVDIQYDTTSEQLLVTAGKEQLRTIEQALEQFAPPKRELKIMQLGMVDPYSFKLAADALFEDEPTSSVPTITVDNEQQQVLVRATREQLESLERLMQDLSQASSLGADPLVSSGSGRVRFIPRVRQSAQLLDEIQRLWPSVGENPLRIVRPSATNQPAEDSQPAQRKEALDNTEANRADVPEDVAEPENADQSLNMPSSREALTTALGYPVLVGLQTPPAGPSVGEDEEPKSRPIMIVLGKDRWIIASEDTAALTQLQRLVDTLRSPKLEPFATTGNFSVYLLQHAGAEDIEEMLTEVFRPSNNQGSASSLDSLMRRVRIVADSRINALIVNGSRGDRQTIEELLGILDSEDLIDTLQQISPVILRLETASAKNVVELLRDVYRSQLSAASSRRPIGIPAGVATDVALLLQQINAQTSGPLLTIAVEETTNSIIMRAPAQLSREIQSFVQELDQDANSTPSTRVNLIRLKSTNTKNMEAALRLLMDQ